MDRSLFELEQFDIAPFDSGELEGGAAARAGEQYVDTAQWPDDPLRGHGGAGANLLLRWNDAAQTAGALDVVVHLHGYISRDADAAMLRAVAARSGLDLTGRQRPTLAILPRGRRITKEEVRRRQAQLDEAARRSGKKPAAARADVYTFPALWRGDGAGIAALIKGALAWFARNRRGGGASLPVARLIFTAHSGGGAALDRLLAMHARSKACNPDEVHAFDALYAKAAGLEDWATARLRADRGRAGGQLAAAGGGLRVFYRPGGQTQYWSELIGRALPARGDPLSRFYRVESTRVEHLDIPNTFGPALLRDRGADVAAPAAAGKGTHAPQGMPPHAPQGTPSHAPQGTPSHRSQGTPSHTPQGTPSHAPQGTPSHTSQGTPPRAPQGTPPHAPQGTPPRAPLPGDVPAWVRSTERSAIDLVADTALRRRLLHDIDWRGEYFPGNPDAQRRKAPGRLAQLLFDAMARVTPERRVPSAIRYRSDIASIVVPIPGVAGKKLHPEAARAFVRLREAAARDGVAIRLLPGRRTAWRTAADQAAIRQGQPNPLAAAGGISAHMYGLAVDLKLGVPGLPISEASTRTAAKMANVVRMYRSPVYKWLVLNASRFGWFPYRREPWHWEYNPPGFAARYQAPVAREFESEYEYESPAHAMACRCPDCRAGGAGEFETFDLPAPGKAWRFETIELESPADMPTLRLGARGAAVADLQGRLAAAGFSPGAADGVFGSRTDSAVRSFQRARGLGVDGVVGPQTWGALFGAAPSAPAPAPAPSAPGGDPAIEALNLAESARSAAYLIKKKHPWVRFTSGRRDPARQASAMAGNVVRNRKWIEQTYADNAVSRAAQAWVDQHPEARTTSAIAAGLLDVFRRFSSVDLGRLSYHLSGLAFDIAPVPSQLTAISATINSLPRLKEFFTREGGLDIWHVGMA